MHLHDSFSVPHTHHSLRHTDTTKEIKEVPVWLGHEEKKRTEE